MSNKRIYICSCKKSDGTLAQLVEQRTENPCVPGSIPGGTTKVSILIGTFCILGD
tara:strand:- start:8393 stop:8557 length:165 start_codon:yes stop_codon:yes gene_type:complete